MLYPPIDAVHLATLAPGSMATNTLLALFLGQTIEPGVTVNNGNANGDY